LAAEVKRHLTGPAETVMPDAPGPLSAPHQTPQELTAAGDGTSDGAPRRDAAGVTQFVERFAGVLVEAGIPRMPARVFAALLATDSGRLTAAELSDQLKASPAAVSGGVRYLIGVGMVRREGEPGSRRHHYRVPDHVWDEVVTGRDRLMARWTAVLREGIELVGAETPAGARLAESVQYFQFVSAELPRVLAKWKEHKAALDQEAEQDADRRI
jgi:DNA-binding transcriptional regulator GbsR (MarR family)